ncbi:hypothetical protein [Streptomyces californicus]|uniref:hypothetical protein n=1 Tax=Streptomyces californicus TaxID=67351 RepID=UPI00296F4645|nr:hypothetical protein [Streptomyces californicus]MDW4918751.1 hypothetical protein [Streptomyces californicus]
MPPDHVFSAACKGPLTGLPDRSIPPAQVVKTRVLRDNQVSIQVGPLVVMPLAIAVLIMRPEAAEAAVACAVLAIAALRRSYVHYQRVHRA